MKIIFSGGGTLGPVTPLLAIHEVIREHYKDSQFVWVGTENGPEKKLVEELGIKFISISSGKLRRYFSIFNLLDLFQIVFGFLQSCRLMLRESPDMCISAGGYVSPPLHLAAWLFGIPTWIHQQDVDVGLSNRLMAPFANKITVSLEETQALFAKNKTSWLGNPVRQYILHGQRARAIKRFGLKENLPVVFVTGGGTGSQRVNQLVVEAVQHLSGVCQIIHLSGKERPQELVDNAKKHFDYYQVYQFFTDEMADAYAVSDIVISRGGFGTISELSALGKAAILIPKPGHQEDNVRFLEQAGAVELVNENTASGNYLARRIRDLLDDPGKIKDFGVTLHRLLPLAKGEDILSIVTFLLKK